MSGHEKKPLVPPLRFPEFRDAGEWESKPLKFMGSFFRGLTYSADEVSEEGLLVLRSSNIQDGTLVLDKDLVFVNKTCPDDIQLRSGDIAICMSNGSKALVGKNAEFRGNCDHDLTVGAFCSIFRPSVEFSKLIFQTPKYTKFISVAIGGGNINNLKNSDLGEFEHPVPKLQPEQQKIADCLSSLDDLIAAETQKLDTLKTHKKGLMQQLFPREGETVPRLRFPEFREAGEWKIKSLGTVCTVLQGYGFPETLQGRTEGQYPFCKVSDISRSVAENGGFLAKAANYVNANDLATLRAKLIPIGATVFAKIGEALRLNRRAFVQCECLIDNNAVGLKAVPGVANDYFIYLLSQLINLNDHCGGAVPSVNKSTLEAIKVVVPEVDEQEKIAASMSYHDELIRNQEKKLGILKIHKAGLMQQLFPVLNGEQA